MKTVQSNIKIDPEKVIWDDTQEINPNKVVWDEPKAQSQNDEYNLKFKIPFTNIKFDLGNNPVGKTILSGGKATIGALGNFDSEVLKTVTGGAVDPAKGTVGVPFTGLRKQIASPMDKYLTERGVSKISWDVGKFAGQATGDLMLMSGINKFISSPAMGQMVKKFPQLANKQFLEQVLSGALTAPGFTLVKKAINEGRTPSPEEFGKDLAFFVAAPFGGKAANSTLGEVIPQLPGLIKAPIEGAAQGLTGLTATIPFMNKEERASVGKEYGPTAASMALFHTLGNLSGKDVPKVDTLIEKAITGKKVSIKLPGKPVQEVVIPKAETQQKIKNDIPIGERNYEDVSKRNVNAYQYDHPEVADHIQAEAIRLVGEMGDPTFFKGQKIVTKDVNDGTVYHNFGISKNVSESFQRIQDATGATYGQIQKALEDIANNQGRENYAVAKKIELIIDDNLTNGTTDIRGDKIEPDSEYILKKNSLDNSAIRTQKVSIPELHQYAKGIKELPNDAAQLQSILDSIKDLPESKLKLNLQFFSEQVKKKLDQLVKEYGAISRGEAPRINEVQVPAATDAGKTRRFARTAAEILPKESSDTIMNAVENEEFAYEPITNTASIKQAETELNGDYEGTYRRFRAAIDSGKRVTAEDIARGEALITHAAKNGDTNMVKELTIDLAAELTNAGQTVQAARLLKKMSPEGYSVYTQRQIDRVNRELKNKFRDKAPKIELTDEERRAILDAPTTEEREEIGMRIASRIAKEMPVSFMEKFNSWRRLAMLFNPKTHVRNIAGNAIFVPFRKIADTIGSGIERCFVPGGQRSKAVGWSKDSGIVKLVDESWRTNHKQLMNDGRWDIGKVLGKEKQIFKNPVLEKLNKLSGETLEKEDRYFLERAYKDALGQYLKANRLTKVTDAAVNYATRRAQEATYRDASVLAKMINQAKRKGGATSIVLESVLPFSKTPINVAKRGMEYSPFGLIRGLANAFKGVPEGRVTATEAIERMAKGLTGSGAMGLGFMLAKMGLLTGAADQDTDKANFDKSFGKQPFSVCVGGKSYTWDWAQPVSLPVAMGVQIFHSIKDDENAVNSAVNGISAGADTVFNLPLLQNVRKTVSGNQSVSEAMFDIFDSYAQQAVPIIGGQLAKTLDPVIRSTYTPKHGKDVTSALGYRADKFKNFALSRIPGLSQKLPPKIDTLGNPVKQSDNVAARAMLNFISPGFFSSESKDPVVKLIDDVYGKTGDKRIFPKTAPKFIKSGAKRYDLTPEEQSEFQQEMGRFVSERLGQKIRDGSFNGRPPEWKAEYIKSIIDISFEHTKAEYLKKKH